MAFPSHDDFKIFLQPICSSKLHKYDNYDNTTYQVFLLFSVSGLSFTDTNDSQDSRGRGETIFYLTLPLPPAHEHWGIYLQLCTWDDYHIFLIATVVFYQTATRWDLPLYQITIWLIDWWCNVCLFTWWIGSKFL